MIKVNGVELPAPSTYQVGIMDLSKAERNANGTMIIERIATKRKIEFSYPLLKDEKLKQILNLIKGVFFTVSYIDTQESGVKTGTFYTGDRVIGAMRYKDGIMQWKDCKFSFIER